MQTAVVVFFVLSGYVIGFVVDAKETTASLFTVSRLARLYSVVLPALILTFICDELGLSINSSFYYQGPRGDPDDFIILRYIASFLFLNSIWG
jgi:peptidoglycan/LPS O-acetylase OafA/YrhL